MSRYAVGIGARPGVQAGAVRALLERVLTEHTLDPAHAVFATIVARAVEPGLLEALRTIVSGAEPVAWHPDDLAAERVPNPDARVTAALGTPSVAEAAALRTARTFPGATGATLVVPKTVGDGVTVAIARQGAGESGTAGGIAGTPDGLWRNRLTR